MIWLERDRNAETLRSQSYCPRISSAFSASPRFKFFRAEIAEHGYVLTPDCHVGAEEVEDYGVPFAEKLATLTSELADQFAETAKLEKAIRQSMKSLGFELPVGGKK
jgi:type I restriction-modification system DNA methylase subunit